MSEEQSEVTVTPQQLLEEYRRIQQVAGDRLVFMRIMEKSLNDINSIMRQTTLDLNELSQIVTLRNNTIVEQDEEE
jgi:hypothetical protein